MKKYVIDGIFVLFGSLLYGVGANIFIIPNNIVLGGATGLATVIHYLVPLLNVGTVFLLLNLPLVAISALMFGKGFVVRTGVAIVSFSVIIDVFTFLPPYRGDMLLSAVFGGVLCGIGIGIALIRGYMTGGSDLLARIIKHRFVHIAMGRLIFIIDAVIVGIAGLVYGNVTNILYSVITIYILSITLDSVVSGNESAKTAIIITEFPNEVRDRIIEKIGRTVTVLSGKGGYEKEEKGIVLSAIANSEIGRLKNAVKMADSEAFVVMIPVKEIFGLGFKSIDEK